LKENKKAKPCYPASPQESKVGNLRHGEEDEQKKKLRMIFLSQGAREPMRKTKKVTEVTTICSSKHSPQIWEQ
jgi:hypothetical protein